jgi:hypothetical protein
MNLPKGPGTSRAAGGPMTTQVPGASPLPKKPDAKGAIPVGKSSLPKGPDAIEPAKKKLSDGGPKGAADGPPMLTRPPANPDRPAATKKPPEERKKKGG